MKSKEQANRTFHNACNSSSSKQQFSFGRDKRFKNRLLQYSKTDYYQLPSKVSKKGGVIGNAKRDCQKDSKPQGPAPGKYDPQHCKTQPQFSFASSRQKCIATSAFYNTTIDYPGPGKYNSSKPPSSKNYVMASRPKTSYETISPGPKYNFESTLLDRNKILSNLRKNLATKMGQPSRKQSRMSYTQVSEEKISVNNRTVDEGYISYSGKKSIGRAGKAATIGRQQRFRPASASKVVPGPGSYSVFSDFIQIVKK